MTSRPELRQQYNIIASFQPALHVPQNWNYENTHSLFEALMHPPTMSEGSRMSQSTTRKKKKKSGSSILM
jgi:hypothetical protein